MTNERKIKLRLIKRAKYRKDEEERYENRQTEEGKEK